MIKLRNHRAIIHETKMFYRVMFVEGFYKDRNVRIGKNKASTNKKRIVREAIRRLRMKNR